MEEKQTELEMILQRTISKLSARIAGLTVELEAARSQIEIMKEQKAE